MVEKRNQWSLKVEAEHSPKKGARTIYLGTDGPGPWVTIRDFTSKDLALPLGTKVTLTIEIEP